MAYRRVIRRKPVKRNCEFCKGDKNPDYKNVENLKKYTTERGKVLGKDRTGLCHKHQKRLSVAIKRARHLAYLPFVAGF
ncbi:MAG: 30S ribosomal protein S18 [Patescibacteria group bacterium]